MKRVLICSLALAAAACASVAPSPQLCGSEWRVTAISGQPTPDSPASYRMAFKDDHLSAQFGCNMIGGDYRIDGLTLRTSAMTMTEMACMGPAAQFEALGIAILGEPMTIAWTGDQQASLSNTKGSVTLVRR